MNAVRICEAKFGALFLLEGDAGVQLRYTEHCTTPMFLEARRQSAPRPRYCPRTGDRTKTMIHIADVRAEPAYRQFGNLGWREISGPCRSRC